jgi:D-serine deaminase-like pyridoxal phosphate-dependent protein
VKRLLLILAIVAAQLCAGPTVRADVSAESSLRSTLAREGADAGWVEAQGVQTYHAVVQVARSRTRTRVQRTTSRASVGTHPTSRFASIVAHRPSTAGTINLGRFVALGLPDTRAP